MKHFLCLAALAAIIPTVFAADVGVSVQVGDPGFYGRIDVNNFPQPRVVYRQPVVIQPAAVEVAREPIYMRVPPGHSKNWRKHCRKYDACGQPVYFVQDRWYNEEYVHRYRERYRGDRHDGRRDDRHDRNDGRNDGHDRGHGRGHGG